MVTHDACRYALGLFIAPLIQALVENNNLYQLDQLGLSFRNALMGAIYRKCLRLNNSALASESTGKIVTLMSNDSQKLQVCAVWPRYLCVEAAVCSPHRGLLTSEQHQHLNRKV